MFVLDSLFVSGLRWVLDKVATAVDAEMNDDTVLREELLAAEMRREMGEISEEAFRAIEADLLARIRAIRERREGSSGPIAFGRGESAHGSEVQVEATLSGDFHAVPSGEADAGSEDEPASGPAAARRQRSSRPGAPRHPPAPRRRLRRSRPSR